MNTTLLRTLTRKSTLKFGKYYDLTVQGVIDLNQERGINYLVWVYFNASKIDFTIDILNELFILETDRLSKPSKLINEQEIREKIKKCKKLRIDRDKSELSAEDFWRKSSHIKAFNKNSGNAESINKLVFQRKNNLNLDTLRRRNQGHKT